MSAPSHTRAASLGPAGAAAAAAPSLSSPRSGGGKQASAFIQQRLQQFSQTAEQANAPPIKGGPPQRSQPGKLASGGALPAASPTPAADGAAASSDVAASPAVAVSPSASPSSPSPALTSPVAAALAKARALAAAAAAAEQAEYPASTSSRPRRNSAPKGAVNSLLSFWKQQEREPAQNAASKGGAGGRPAVERGASLQQQQQQQQRSVPPSASPSASAVASSPPCDVLSSSPPSASGIVAPAATATKDSLALPPPTVEFSPHPLLPGLSPAPSTLSPCSPREDDPEHDGRSPEGWRSATSSLGESTSGRVGGRAPGAAHTTNFLDLPPALPNLTPVSSSPAAVQGAGVAAAALLEQEDLHPSLDAGRTVSDPCRPVSNVVALINPSALPPANSLPSPPAFGLPSLTRCVTDYESHEATVLPQQSDHRRPSAERARTSHPAEHNPAVSAHAAHSTSSAPPLLMREVTDAHDPAYHQLHSACSTSTPEALDSRSVHPAVSEEQAPLMQRETTDLLHLQQGFASHSMPQQQQQQQQQHAVVPGLPSLTREVTDPLHQSTQWSDGHPAHHGVDDVDASAHKAVQIQPFAAVAHGVPTSVPPLLSRLVTDPCDEGQSLPAASGDIDALTMPARGGEDDGCLGSASRGGRSRHDSASLFPQQQRHPSGAEVAAAAAAAGIVPAPLMARVQTELDMAQLDDDHSSTSSSLQVPSSSAAADVSRSRPASITSPAPLMVRVQTEIDMHSLDEQVHSHHLSSSSSSAAATEAAANGVISPAPLITRVQTEMNMHASDQQQHDKQHHLEYQQHQQQPHDALSPTVAQPFLSRHRTEVHDSPCASEEDYHAQVVASASPPHAGNEAGGAAGGGGYQFTRQTTDVCDSPENNNGAGGDDVEDNASGRSSRAETEAAEDEVQQLTPDEESEQAQKQEQQEEQEEDAEQIRALSVQVERVQPKGVTDGGLSSAGAPPAAAATGTSAAADEEEDEVSAPAFVDEDESAKVDDTESADAVPSELSLPPGARGARGATISSSPPADEFSAGGRSTPSASFQLPTPPTPTALLAAALASPMPVPPSPSGRESSGSVSGAESAAGAGKDDSAAAQAQMASFRSRVEGELLSTEESYVASLEVLVKQFIHPLKSNSEAIGVTQGQIGLIFSNVELLYNFHTIFLHDLRLAVKASQQATADAAAGVAPTSEAASSPTSAAEGSPPKKKAPATVSDLICKFGDFLRMYTQYLAGYSVGLDTIASLRANGKFTAFLLEKRAAAAAAAEDAAKTEAARNGTTHKAMTNGGLDLMSYLIMPVQRIPRYLLLLKELLRYTPRGHPELERLQQAYGKVQDIARHVNDSQKHIENMSVLLSIQNSIESTSLSSKLGQLMVPHRRLIRSGIIQKLSTGLLSTASVRRVYLFNDLLLWCETAASLEAPVHSQAPTGSEKFSGFVELSAEGLLISEYFAKKGVLGFKLATTKPKKEHIFLVQSSAEKIAWLTDIRAAQNALAETTTERKRRTLSSMFAPGTFLVPGGTPTTPGNGAGAGAGTTPSASSPTHVRAASSLPPSSDPVLNKAASTSSVFSSPTSSSPSSSSSSMLGSPAITQTVTGKLSTLPSGARARPASAAVFSTHRPSPSAAAASGVNGAPAGATRGSAAPTLHPVPVISPRGRPSPPLGGAGGEPLTPLAAEPVVEEMSQEEWERQQEELNQSADARGRRGRATSF